MAVLERIRVKFGVAITVIIAIALLSFIIDPSTLSSVMYTRSSKYDVGQIDGKRIDYQRYQQDVDTYNKLNEIITGSSASTDEQQKNVRDAAWQALVDEYLFIKNCKAAGLFVGKDEKIDLTTGNAVSPVLAQDPNFADENGVFSVDRLKDFVQQVSSDESGRLKIYWDYLQKAVVTAAYYQKYTSLFTRSNVENTLLSARAIEENNTTADIEFVMTSVGYAADSTIQVTDKEVEKYYKAHKKNYKCEASRDIEYVVFEVKPSSEDIAAANEKIASLYDEFAKTDNPKTFLRNSDRKFDSRWYGKGELNSVDREVAEFVDANRVGAVSKVIEGDEAFYAVRILDKKMMPNDIDVKLAVAGNVDKIDAALEAKLDASQEMNMTQDRLVSGCEVLFDAPLNKVQLIDSPQYGKLAAKYKLRVIPMGDAVQLFRKYTPVKFQPSTEKWEYPKLPSDAGDVVGGSFWRKEAKTGNKKLAFDAHHLNADGHYLQACLWFAFLYGEPAGKITWMPNGMKNACIEPPRPRLKPVFLAKISASAP